ncbi:MAG: hypothetical protein WC986_14810 [Elusimicrobiota bacterium]|jgi:hypothetical protein
MRLPKVISWPLSKVLVAALGTERSLDLVIGLYKRIDPVDCALICVELHGEAKGEEKAIVERVLAKRYPVAPRP